MLFFIVLDFFCGYSIDSMKKALVTQEMAPIIINTPNDPIRINVVLLHNKMRACILVMPCRKHVLYEMQIE